MEESNLASFSTDDLEQAIENYCEQMLLKKTVRPVSYEGPALASANKKTNFFRRFMTWDEHQEAIEKNIVDKKYYYDLDRKWMKKKKNQQSSWKKYRKTRYRIVHFNSAREMSKILAEKEMRTI